MREDIVKGGRGFLDIFWNLGSPDARTRSFSCKKLISHIFSSNNPNKAEQLEYALERLVKGLRSPTLSAREGFSTALVALIQKDETCPTKELLKLVDKHIYSFKAADQKEGAALNAAKLLVPKILLDAGRFDKLFLTGSEAAPDATAAVTENPMVVSLPTEKLRLVVLDDLRQVTVCLLSRCSSSSSSSDARDSVQTFAREALDFFLMASLSAGPLNPLSVSPDCVTAVTERVANFAGTQLAKCISLLCRRVSLRAELKATPEGRGSSSHRLEAMSILLSSLIHLVKTAIRLCGDTESSDVPPIVSRLKTARRLLRLAEESKSADSSAQWIAILDAIAVLYLLTLHSSPPSPKETALLTVVDDISECHKRRSASAAGEEAMETEETGTASPEWSSVLTDAMLTLSVEPWRLLRETIAATFSRLVANSELLEFKKTSTNQSAIVEATLKDILSEFLTRTRPSRTHRLILLRLLSSSPSYAKVAQEVLLDRMDDVLLSSEAHVTTGNTETTSTKGVFMQTTFLQVATAITTGLAKAQSSADLVHAWISKLLKGLVKHFYSVPSPCAWTKSQKLSQAVFTSVFECIKADQSALDDLTEQELHALLSFERTSVHKSVRPLHSRVLQLVHSMKGRNGRVDRVLCEMSSSKQRLKDQRKRERREKRRLRAEQQAARRQAADGGDAGDVENTSLPPKQQKQRKDKNPALVTAKRQRGKKGQSSKSQERPQAKRRKMEVD
nr:unnamed protein product [Spirometra erinaceieuropaei]